MLAIVCKTYEDVKALEEYDINGKVDKNLGLHALGLSIGIPIDDRFLVICLEKLRQETFLFITFLYFIFLTKKNASYVLIWMFFEQALCWRVCSQRSPEEARNNKA